VKHARIAHAKQCPLDAEKEALQEEEAGGHDANFGSELS
jgi:hypothetical protein